MTRQKRVAGTQNNPSEECLSNLAPREESEMPVIVDAMQIFSILKIIRFLLKNRLSGARIAL